MSIDCIVIGHNYPPISNTWSRRELGGFGLTDDVSRVDRARDLMNHIDYGGEWTNFMRALSKARARHGGDRSEYTTFDTPQLAVTLLSSHLHRAGMAVEFITSFRSELGRLEELIKTSTPKSIAITTTYYFNPQSIVEIIRFVRRLAPGIKIIVGGPWANKTTRWLRDRHLSRSLELIDADVYVRDSQGELALVQVVSRIKESKSLSDVPNIFYRDHPGGSFSFTREEPENNPMDESTPAFDLFPNDYFAPISNMRTARSCAFNCSFCDYPATAGALRTQSLEVVEHQLQMFKKAGAKHVVFMDDTFNVPRKRFAEILRMMIKNDFGFRWYSYFRVSDARTPDIYDLMKESGCGGVFLGIESANPDVLKNMNKRATPDMYRFGIEQLKQRGIFTVGGFVIGFPGDSWEVTEENASFINETGLDFYTPTTFALIPSAPIAHMADKYGLTGVGMQWKHDTMDSSTAQDAASHLMSLVEHSIYTPTVDVSMWGVQNLLAKGLDLEQCKGLLSRFGDVVELNPVATRRSVKGVYRDRVDAFETYAASLPLGKSKFQIQDTSVLRSEEFRSECEETCGKFFEHIAANKSDVVGPTLPQESSLNVV